MNNPLSPNVAYGRTTTHYPKNPDELEALRSSIRRLYAALGLDDENPFRDFVQPGGLAVIKPNWVRDHNPLGHSLDSLITHPSLCEVVLDDLAHAMQEKGTIVIGDAPLQNCDFANLLESSGMNAMVQSARTRHPNLTILVEDWRLTTTPKHVDGTWKRGVVQNTRDDFGGNASPSHTTVDLGKESFLEEIAELSDRFRVTRYKPSLMRLHHAPGKHEYLVTKRIFEADCIINLPKMKTHIKAGLTGALKNLVGINGHKEYLPHHIKGAFFEGGDNYVLANRFRRTYENLYDAYWENLNSLPIWKRKWYQWMMMFNWQCSRIGNPDPVNAGSWRGNETIWRTTLDLNHLLYFQKRDVRIFTLVDGIIAGEGEGPLIPTPKAAGVLIAGENPASIDAVIARLMGYIPARIPTVYAALTHRHSRFAPKHDTSFPIVTFSDDGRQNHVTLGNIPSLHFSKPSAWQGA